jgi:hypothetical protein
MTGGEKGQVLSVQEWNVHAMTDYSEQQVRQILDTSTL